MTVLLSGRWSAAEGERWAQLLREAMPEAQWLLRPPRDAAEAAAVELAVVANPEPGALSGLPNLRLIQSLWAGVDRLLQDPTLPPGVPLARMVDPAMNEAMVHTALWAVLSLHRRFFELQAQQRQALWQAPPQLRASECVVLVLGLGELGGRTAQALAGLGYAVHGWSRSPRELPGVRGWHGEAPEGGLASALAVADIVINLLPLTPQTRGFFSAERLAQMRPGACLVNLARGAHVDEAALHAALDRGHLRHAVLDVFQHEPLPPDHAFWRHPQVTVLPHCAAQTDPRSAVPQVQANLAALRAGRPLAHLVDRGQGY